MSKEDKLGICHCGKNMDLPGIGKAHRCYPPGWFKPKKPSALVSLPKKARAVKEEAPISEEVFKKPEGQRAIGRPSKVTPEELQKAADGVKKLGRPKKAEGFDKAAYMRKYKAEKRAAAKEGK